MRRDCKHCGYIFDENDLEISHDKPRWLKGTDKDGRHYLCKDCHKEYELLVLKIALRYVFKRGAPQELIDIADLAVKKAKAGFFSE